jgi:hypothetical protein
MRLVRGAGFSLLDTMILLSRRVTMPDDAMRLIFARSAVVIAGAI